MANKLKKALAELEETRKRISEIKVEKKTEQPKHVERRVIKPTVVSKPVYVAPIHFDEGEKFDRIDIKKVEKGKYVAYCADGGKLKNKNFKSITKAEEWKASHLR